MWQIFKYSKRSTEILHWYVALPQRKRFPCTGTLQFSAERSILCMNTVDKKLISSSELYLDLLLMVFVKLNQNDFKYWDGNAVYQITALPRPTVIAAVSKVSSRWPRSRSHMNCCCFVYFTVLSFLSLQPGWSSNRQIFHQKEPASWKRLTFMIFFGKNKRPWDNEWTDCFYKRWPDYGFYSKNFLYLCICQVLVNYL